MILLGPQMRRGFEQIRHCRGCDPLCCLPMLSLALCGLNLGLVSPEMVPLPCLGHTGTVACFQPWSQLRGWALKGHRCHEEHEKHHAAGGMRCAGSQKEGGGQEERGRELAGLAKPS